MKNIHPPKINMASWKSPCLIGDTSTEMVGFSIVFLVWGVVLSVKLDHSFSIYGGKHVQKSLKSPPVRHVRLKSHQIP